jgi:endonuclease/exonuclease/phosphatase family metal-dependent hydrolase
VVHLPLGRVTDQRPIVSRLVEALSIVKTPLVVAGDFNFAPEVSLVELLRGAGLVDATESAGPTMPNPTPVVRLDYIFVAPAESWKITGVWTFGEEGDANGFLPSDHLGVIVDARFREDI